MNKDVLHASSLQWMEDKGPEPEVVVSSRVRLARNLRQIPFPHLMGPEDGQKLVRDVKAALEQARMPLLEGLTFYHMAGLSPVERQILMEKHLISPEMANTNDNYRGVFVNGRGSVAIMVNEEDHLRIQTLLPGLQLNQAYKYAEMVDDALEKKLDYAFDEKRGYLTSCPTNVGTGMRASVMLHLPAITMANQAMAIFENVRQFGLVVRGVYGEGSQVQGNLYQLSNQITLGQTEEETINNLWSITMQIVEQEKNLRRRMLGEIGLQIEDKVMRSYGLLTHARQISSQEALELLSDVRLGVELGIIKGLKYETLNELMIAIRPAHLQYEEKKEMEPAERDMVRARIIKERLKINDR